MNIRYAIGAIGVSCLVSACAGLDYLKVPTPTQYSNWTDNDQKTADAMKGVRYYLPRPFLHLKQSTPVAQRTALVSFRYDNAQKAYVLEVPQDNPTWVRKIAPTKISITQALAATMAGKPLATSKNGGEQVQSTKAGAGEDGKSDESAKGDSAQKTGPDTSPPASPPPSDLHARTGFINDTDPITRLGDRMDVVYLPDFEEQFVIKQKFGLGKADIETRLRNGWAAEVFAQKVDNSNLIPYVVDQLTKTSDAAAGIFTTWLPVASGLPPGAKPPSLPQLQSSKAGEPDQQAAKNFLGDILIFKLAEVKIAQPGLYPILKPREIRQWLKFSGVVSGSDPEASFDAFLRQSQVPWIRPDMAFIPCPPFTMIGFNTTTDVFLAPATDRIEEIASLEPPPKSDGKQPGANKLNDESTKKIEDALKKKDVAKEKLGDALALQLELSSLTVAKDALGKSVVVSVPLKGAFDLTNDVKNKIASWIADVTPAAKDKSDVKAVVTDPSGDKRLEVQINATAQEVAGSITQ
jgi:hypothetical protein